MQNNKEYLYNKYKNLIYKVIKDCNCQYRNEEEYQDYYDAGEMGLINAINCFDSSQEEKVSYFYKSIKNEILHYFNYKNYFVRKINYLDMNSLEKSVCDIETSVSEVIKDESVNTEQDLLKKETCELLYKAIDTLKPTYKDLICKYYGINSKKYTLRKIAKLHKISWQAITVKRNNALKKLKEKLIKYGVDKNDL